MSRKDIVDIRTLTLVLGLASLLQMFVLSIQYTIGSTKPGDAWWILGMAFFAVSYFTNYFNGIDFGGRIALTAESFFMAAGLVALWLGIRNFFGRSSMLGVVASALLVYLALSATLSFSFDAIGPIFLLRTSIAFTTSCLTVWELRRASNPDLRSSIFFLCLSFAAHGLFSLVRMGIAVNDLSTSRTEGSHSGIIAAYLFMLVEGLLWTTGYILLLNLRLHAATQKARREFEIIFRNTPEAVILFGEDKRMLDANEVFCQLTGYTLAEIVERTALELGIWENEHDRDLLISELKARGRSDDHEFRFHRKDGSVFIGLISAIRLKRRGSFQTICVVRDITERARIEHSLKESEKHYRLLADNSTDVIWTMEMHGHFTYASPSLKHLMGIEVEEFLTYSPWDLLTPSSKRILRPRILRAIAGTMHAIKKQSQNGVPAASESEVEERPISFEAEFVHKDGSAIWTETTAHLVLDSLGQPSGFTGMTRDIRERKRLEQALIEKARTDALTGIASRAWFLEQIEQEPAKGSIEGKRAVLALIDLDNLKKVNDSLGHLKGDELLRSMGRIGKGILQGQELFARFGGDEFIILFPDSNVEQCRGVLEQFRLAAAREPIPFTISAGIALAASQEGEAARSFDAFVERADGALYRAKQAGRDRIVVA